KKIGVGIIHNERGQILIDRRLAEGEMGGLWEFPGGKIEPNETIKECIKREIKEELGIEILVRESLITIEHQYPKFKVTLFVHHCQYLQGTPQAIECEEVRWVNLLELDKYTFPEANYEIINLLKSSVQKY
ncbi:8-oxo-dGTP diphosphatase MutT, partial [Hyella patelloides]